MRRFWRFLRKYVVGWAIRNPGPTAGVVFLFFFTVSNHVEFATGMALPVSPFWHMLMSGAMFATFAAVLLYEVIRLHRQLAEASMVRRVVSTLQHEINNPLQVIRLSAERMQEARSYQENTIVEILQQGSRIGVAVGKLAQLTGEVPLDKRRGFEGFIKVDHSA